MLELNAPRQKQNALKIACDLSYGGDSLNTSVYLARLGTQVSYVTALGDDSLSQWMMSQWQNEGVNCDLVHRKAGSVPGMYLIELDDNGERSFKYWRKHSPASQWLSDDELRSQVFERLSEFDYVYLSGISVAILPETTQAELIRFLQEYREQGGQVIFDGNYRPKLWPSVERAIEVYQQLYTLCNIALPTFEDEQAIFSDVDAEAALTRFMGYQIDCVALKLGEEGCTYLVDGCSYMVPSIKVEVVDTTSAGDAFNAGFIDAILNQKSVEAACLAGHRLASTVIQHRGAIIPSAAMPSQS